MHLRKGLPLLDDYVERNLIISDQSAFLDHILILIDEDGRYVDFTLERMIQILDSVSIDYHFPMNMPRHYLRNHFYHVNASNDLADVWMGHQRDGREILNITSTTLAETALTQGLSHVDGMMSDIGFVDIEYLPSRCHG